MRKEVQQFLEKEISRKAPISEFVIVPVGTKPDKMHLSSSRPGQGLVKTTEFIS